MNHNKIGRFEISTELLRLETSAIRKLFDRVMVLEAKCLGNTVRYVAYSEYFEPFDDCNDRLPPKYKFDFVKGSLICAKLEMEPEYRENADLLPCPFCGCKDFDVFKGDSGQVTAIYCKDCPAGVEDSTITLEKLKLYWNTRI